MPARKLHLFNGWKKIESKVKVQSATLKERDLASKSFNLKKLKFWFLHLI